MGGNRIPIQLRESDISRILKDEILDRHVDAKLTKYVIGETIIVNDGPFATFEGIISEVKEDDKVDIEIKIFGRANTISLNMNQIQKI
jgi:transcriptional antiterminator NusG